MRHKFAKGMNQQQYSVPRTELLAWINNTLSLHVTKVEQVTRVFVRPALYWGS